MTLTVTVRIEDIDALGGTSGTEGASLVVSPYFTDLSGPTITSTAPVTVDLDAGEGSFGLAPAEVRLIRPVGVAGLERARWVVLPPADTEISLAALVIDHAVDPATLEPLQPLPPSAQQILDDAASAVDSAEEASTEAGAKAFNAGESAAAALGHANDAAVYAATAATASMDNALSARNGHKNVMLAGVIRNAGVDPTYWELLPIGTNHRPINIDSVQTITDGDGVNGYIQINYTLLGAHTTVAFIAVPDETLASHGFVMGTSVTETRTVIRMAQAAREASDYVYFDGTNWVSQDGVFTTIAFDSATGKLSLTHGALAIPQAAQYAISVEARGLGYRYQVAATGAPTASNRVDIQIYDDSPELEDYVSYNGSAWVSAKGVYAGFTFSAGVLTLNHASVPAADAERVSLEPRGVYNAHVSASGSPTTSTAIKIEFYNAAGVLVTTPDTSMKVYVRRGGSTHPLVTAPTTGMKLYVSHGGGTRRVHPKDVTTALYPSSNIWLFGVMELPA